MNEIINFIKDPKFWAAVTGLIVVLRAIGELFKLIGKLIPGEDWFEGASAKISIIVTKIGKFITFFGIGNPQNKKK